MEYTVSYLFVLFLIGAIGSILSGMVGIGGSVIKYPMLLYIPPLLGFVAFTAQEVAAISAVQVFFSTLAALIVFKKGGYVSFRLVAYMGTAIVLGSFIGAYGSTFLANETINFVYAILASLAAILMFLPKPKGSEDVSAQQLTFNRLYAVILSFIVGVASGIVGAAGAFIIVPIMLVILKVPTRIAIGSSVAITFISSIGATVGKVMGGHMLPVPSIVMVVASLLAAPIGAKLSQKINTKTLEYILLVLIVATVIKIWYEMFT
ncbi:sulfite exporter TauE/SafE family protein [Anoxybacillus flavithermus]|uniref:Probable membrane transporter protein n=1 Tax=Anoxybacillus flavithermus AK1 TaxID=1297581 RepID=M8CTQ4_9BACL|nr:sulfite exporter TauE/SafE family protein [Anoxybacillus flavithermus]EMT44923.1 permease [Anoxybacillus flavithermus AK1]